MQPSGRNAVVRLVIIAALAMLGGIRSTVAQQAVYSEDDVKAAFLYHFGTYVAWPVPASAQEPITIVVLGAPTVAERLQAFLPGRTIQGRPVAVRALAELDALAGDEILFIGSQFNDRLSALIETIGQQPVLIVSDAENGLEQGAMVNFQLVDQRLRFEVSLRAAQDAGLMLSSRLLSAALRVETVDCGFHCHLLGPGNRV
jgi:hypothetical protein